MCCREATPQDLASVLRQAERLHQSLSPFIRQLCQLADSDPVVQQQVDSIARLLYFRRQRPKKNSECSFPSSGKWLEMVQDIASAEAFRLLVEILLGGLVMRSVEPFILAESAVGD